MEEESKFHRGYQKMGEIDGDAGQKVIESLKDISPDLGKYIIEYAFGDIYCRDGLDLKAKEIAVVAALTALGNAWPQLKVHINGALNVGCTINEVKEIILQMSSYAGFPCCINAMNTLKEVIEERKTEGINDPLGAVPTNQMENDDRYEVGVRELSILDSMQVEKLKKAYNDFAPELVNYIVNAYADIFARNNLDKEYRQIATIAALTALGNAQPQLEFHIKAGFNIGLTLQNIRETILLMTVYAGFPAAINGMNILKEVLNGLEN